ncbi:hypothetical protein ES703_44826 [subsurface metagenome]
MKEIDKIIKKIKIIFHLKDEEIVKEESIQQNDIGITKEEKNTYIISSGIAIPLEKIGEVTICEICRTIENRRDGTLICHNCGISLCLKCVKFFGENNLPLCPSCHKEFLKKENLWERENGYI